MANPLDNRTILRFAKAFRSGAGIEQHLENLDRILLMRNKVKIIRMYLRKHPHDVRINREIGQGVLIEIPMSANTRNIKRRPKIKERKQSRALFLKAIFRDVILYNSFLYPAFFRHLLKRYYHPPQGQFPIINAGEKFRRMHQEYKIDLLVMHYVGTADSEEIIEEAAKLRIPYVFINHFSNDRFRDVSIREQLQDAAGIAGVCGVGIPSWLKGRFCNVSNGIDVDFFNPEGVEARKNKHIRPIIFYPARIVPAKGQIDLIKAYGKLQKEGLRGRLVLAGRADSREYENSLRKMVKREGLDEDVTFLGELDREEVLKWYKKSSILAFPTYHQEGLPRILMEAQAMKVPLVAYTIGGVPEAVINGKTGFLVKKGDIDAFTEKLQILLSKDELRRRMGEEGRKFVEERFSLEALAERHERFYLSVLGRRKNGR